MSRQPGAPALFIGDVALDEYFATDTWVMPGDKGLIETREVYVGGSIANAARVHAGFAGSAEFVSLLNHGELTQRLLGALTGDSVDVTHMLYDDTIGDQRNLIFLVGGEHIVLTPDVDDRPMRFEPEALASLSQPGFVYTTLNRAERLRAGELGAAAVLRALRGGGRKLVFDLDVDGLADGDNELLRGAHVVMMNDHGFTRSFGAGAAESAVREWMAELDIDVVLRSRAAAGVMAYSATETLSVPGFSVPVTDVTGAGDTLGGSLVYALGAGMSLEDAVSFAVAAASRSVMHMGPNGGVATIGEVEEFATRFAN